METVFILNVKAMPSSYFYGNINTFEFTYWFYAKQETLSIFNYSLFFKSDEPVINIFRDGAIL